MLDSGVAGRAMTALQRQQHRMVPELLVGEGSWVAATRLGLGGPEEHAILQGQECSIVPDLAEVGIGGDPEDRRAEDNHQLEEGLDRGAQDA